LANFTAFLDASVLYPAPLRDLLLEVAVSDLYRAKWSNAVHEEWINVLLRTRTDLTIKGQADLIVTANLKDFPNSTLGRWGVEAQHPDEFLTNQFHLSQPVFLKAVRTVRLRLKNPPKSVEEYLDTLRAQGLLATVSEIAPFDQFI